MSGAMGTYIGLSPTGRAGAKDISTKTNLCVRCGRGLPLRWDYEICVPCFEEIKKHYGRRKNATILGF